MHPKLWHVGDAFVFHELFVDFLRPKGVAEDYFVHWIGIHFFLFNDPNGELSSAVLDLFAKVDELIGICRDEDASFLSVCWNVYFLYMMLNRDSWTLGHTIVSDHYELVSCVFTSITKPLL